MEEWFTWAHLGVLARVDTERPGPLQTFDSHRRPDGSEQGVVTLENHQWEVTVRCSMRREGGGMVLDYCNVGRGNANTGRGNI